MPISLKHFAFGGDKARKKSLNLSLDIYNLFNTINRADPIGNMSSPNFLQVIKGATDNDSIMVNEAYYASYGLGQKLKFYRQTFRLWSKL